MSFKPRSLGWLIAHDLKMSWRMLADIFAGWSALATTVAVVGGMLGVHALAAAVVLVRARTDFAAAGSDHVMTVGLAVLFWMTAQGLLGATRSLYERGHLEVLFSSPLPVWKAVVARAVAIMATSLVSVGLLTLPLANAGAIIEGPQWLVVYPVELALALLGTAAGLLLAIGLFMAFGPRRARQISQVVAAGIAGAFILGVQVAAVLPDRWLDWIAATTNATFAFLHHGEGHGSAIVPMGLLRGDLGAVATFLAVSAILFAAAVLALSGAFAKASLAAAGCAPSGPPRAAVRPFREGIAASLRRKEWRLLVRDPNLFAQLSLQIIYTLPVIVLLLRNSNEIPPALALAPFIVVLATQISASLAWIAVSGEDAPELIQSAPVGDSIAALAKLSAIAAPVAVILAAPLLALIVQSPSIALTTSLIAVTAGTSAALLNFWHPMAGNRRGLLRRHSQSKVVALAEHGLSILWALAAVFAVVDARLIMLPLTGIATILWLFKPKPQAALPIFQT
jgi:ABC-2 type transport system permease protein